MTPPKLEDLLPGILPYELGYNRSTSISTEGLEEIVRAVRAKTGLSENDAQEITISFFQEMRNAVLNGERVRINSFHMFISSPLTIANKSLCLIIAQLNKKFRKKLHES